MLKAPMLFIVCLGSRTGADRSERWLRQKGRRRTPHERQLFAKGGRRAAETKANPLSVMARLSPRHSFTALRSFGAPLPGMGVTNDSLARAVSATREAAGTDTVIIAGRMHASGSVSQSGSRIVDDRSLENFVAAGADIVLLPAPGTVPGCHEALVRSWVDTVHSAGALTMTAMGTSQEGSDEDTIRRIALMAKMTGTDIHHLGDCGFFGIALPENLLAYSIAIRGRRHTYRRMGMSLLR